MNKLPIAKRTQIIQLLVEGMSLRATSRIADVSINTVTKLLVDVGAACQRLHDATVIGVESKRVKCDEIWSFVYAKEKNVEDAAAAPDKAGDVWTWTGIDADSKLIVSWYVGNRDEESAMEFMQDIKSRISNRIQLTTDGHKPYLTAVESTFEGHIDCAQLVKIYGTAEGLGNERRYSQPLFAGNKKNVVAGRPDEDYISTSYVERQNQTMRIHMRRFTRLTNAFSKKIENHCHAIALHFVYYNFCKLYDSLWVTPAMEAGLAKKPMTIQQIVALTD
ncbi:IS1 family transposase [Larkinella ripae]